MNDDTDDTFSVDEVAEHVTNLSNALNLIENLSFLNNQHEAKLAQLGKDIKDLIKYTFNNSELNHEQTR